MSPNVSKLARKGNVAGLIEALGHEDWQVRREAASALGGLRDARAVDPLIAALADDDPGVQQVAVRALAAIGDVRCSEALIDALGFKGELSSWEGGLIPDLLANFGEVVIEPVVTAHASGRLSLLNVGRVLGRLRGSAAAAVGLNGILERLRKEEPTGLGHDSATHIVEALALVGTPEAVDGLSRILTDETGDSSFTARRMAREALDGAGWKARDAKEATWHAVVALDEGLYDTVQVPEEDPYAVPEWAAEASEGLVSEWGPDVLAVALHGLERDGLESRVFVHLLWAQADRLDDSAIESLAKAAERDDVRISYWATCALVRMASDAVVPVLKRMVSMSRRVTVLRPVYDSEYVTTPKEEGAQNTAQRGLAQKELHRRLRLAESESPEQAGVRERTATAQAAIVEGRVGPLIRILGDSFRSDDRKTADKIVRALGKAGQADPVALAAGLEDETSNVRWAIAQILGRVGGSEAIAPLTKALDDPDEGVRVAASVALARIQSS